jgi:hypothetical protein
LNRTPTHHPTIPPRSSFSQVLEFRLDELKTVMLAESPVASLEKWRPFLKKHAKPGLSTTHSNHMTMLISNLLEEEQVLVEKERRNAVGGLYGTIIDGATFLDEVEGAVNRFISLSDFLETYEIKHRLSVLSFLQAPLTGLQLASEVKCNDVNVLKIKTAEDRKLCLCFARDRVSANNVAVAELTRMGYTNAWDAHCFSHTMVKPGDEIVTTEADIMFALLTHVCSSSHAARKLFSTVMGVGFDGGSSSRWFYAGEKKTDYFGRRWSKFVVFVEKFATLKTQAGSPVCPSSARDMKALMDDPLRSRQLRMEAASLLDVGTGFIQACYNLEGDGLTVLNAYDEVNKLQVRVRVEGGCAVAFVCPSRMTHPHPTAAPRSWRQSRQLRGPRRRLISWPPSLRRGEQPSRAPRHHQLPQWRAGRAGTGRRASGNRRQSVTDRRRRRRRRRRRWLRTPRRLSGPSSTTSGAPQPAGRTMARAA